MPLHVHPCILQLPGDPLRRGLEVQRLTCRDLAEPAAHMEVRACNLPRLIHHYGDGLIDWGSDGPETADLALSLLAVFIPVGADGRPGRPVESATVSQFAWDQHFDLATRHLSALPQAGGRIDADFLRIWIAGRWPWKPGTREPREDGPVDLSEPDPGE